MPPRTSTWSSCATGRPGRECGSRRQRPPAASSQCRLDHSRRQVEVTEEHGGHFAVRTAPCEAADRGELPPAPPRHERQVRRRDRDRAAPRRLHRHPQRGPRLPVAVGDRGTARVRSAGTGLPRTAARQGRDRDRRHRQPADQADPVGRAARVRVGSRPAGPAQCRIAEERGCEHARAAEQRGQLRDLVQLTGAGQAAVDLLHGHDVHVQRLDRLGRRVEVDRGCCARPARAAG